MNLANGSYRVRVELPGYQPGEEAVELMGGTSRRVIVMLYPDPNSVRGVTIVPDDPVISAKFLAAPEKARNELSQAREARQRGDCKSAIKHGKKATEIAPDFAIAYVETGMCELDMGALDKARESFKSAIERDPKLLYGYIGLSHVEAKAKRWNEAAQALGTANKVQPDRAEPFYELARLQLQTGHPDKAEMAAKTALSKDHSRLPDLPFLLARIYVLENRNDEAVKLLREIEKTSSDNAVKERAKRSLQLLEKDAAVKK